MPDSARADASTSSPTSPESCGCRTGVVQTETVCDVLIMSGSRRPRSRQVKRSPALTAADIQTAYRYVGLGRPRRSPFECGELRPLSRRPCDCSLTRAVISPSADGVSGVMASRSRSGCQGSTATKALDLAASERRLLLTEDTGSAAAKDSSGVILIRYPASAFLRIAP